MHRHHHVAVLNWIEIENNMMIESWSFVFGWDSGQYILRHSITFFGSKFYAFIFSKNLSWSCDLVYPEAIPDTVDARREYTRDDTQSLPPQGTTHTYLYQEWIYYSGIVVQWLLLLPHSEKVPKADCPYLHHISVAFYHWWWV